MVEWLQWFKWLKILVILTTSFCMASVEGAKIWRGSIKSLSFFLVKPPMVLMPASDKAEDARFGRFKSSTRVFKTSVSSMASSFVSGIALSSIKAAASSGGFSISSGQEILG